MHFMEILQFAMLAGFLHSTTAWTYNELEKWPGKCSTGKSQSPIDLQYEIAEDYEASPLEFINYKKDYRVIVENNGHSVEIKMPNKGARPQITGGMLNGTYTLDHLHFHWGSEHTIDGRRFPVELHAVHYNSKFNNLSEAAKVPNGLAVFATLFELSPDDIEELDIVMDIIDALAKQEGIEFNSSHPIRPKDYLPSDTAGYFLYSGSLTTPNCAEVVTWTIFTNKLVLSKKQVDYFHSFAKSTYRPVQELNDRTIYLKQSPLNSSQEKVTVSVFLLIISVSFWEMFS